MGATLPQPRGAWHRLDTAMPRSILERVTVSEDALEWLSMSPWKKWHRTPIGLGEPTPATFLDMQDEETVTYDARRTPAVSRPALLLETPRARKPPVAPPLRPSMPTVPISPEDSDVEILAPHEMPVFDLQAPATEPWAPLRPRPSFVRWFLARLLFLVILALVALLGAAELSVALHEPRLDPRPFLLRGARLLAAKIDPPH